MPDYSHYQHLSVTITDGLATIAFNRPDALNAIDMRMHEELATVFFDVGRDHNARVIMLTGIGDHFCAGGDLGWMKDAAEGNAPIPDAMEAKRIIFSLLDLEKPIIAKVHGSCVGLGATLALFCDTIFAADDARIADPHVRVGIVAGDGGAVIWPQLIGYARAKEYLMTGDPLSGAKAAAIGLINHAVPAGELDKAADDFAQRLLTGPLKAIMYTKTAVNIGLKQLAHSIMDTSVAYEIQTFDTDDHREAVDAFLTKRTPVFKGE